MWEATAGTHGKADGDGEKMMAVRVKRHGQANNDLGGHTTGLQREESKPTLKFMTWQLNGGGRHPLPKDRIQEEESGWGFESGGGRRVMTFS